MDENGVNCFMKREALDIIVRLWSINEPFTNADRYWIVKNEEAMCGSLKPHITADAPGQDGYPRACTERHGIPVVVLVSLEERLDASRGDQANVVPVWLNLARDVIRASGPLPRWAPHCCVERRSASSGQV